VIVLSTIICNVTSCSQAFGIAASLLRLLLDHADVERTILGTSVNYTVSNLRYSAYNVPGTYRKPSQSILHIPISLFKNPF
jgi:hypothetical protein